MKRKLAKIDHDILKEHFKTYTAVAKRLGISNDYYRRVRNHPDEFPPSEMLSNSIQSLARSIVMEKRVNRAKKTRSNKLSRS